MLFNITVVKKNIHEILVSDYAYLTLSRISLKFKLLIGLQYNSEKLISIISMKKNIHRRKVKIKKIVNRMKPSKSIFSYCYKKPPNETAIKFPVLVYFTWFTRWDET